MVVLREPPRSGPLKLAIDRYIADRGYGIGTLVAFSGEVKDPESGPDSG